MAPKPIPDRWLDYKACGNVIEGTRIICFKVPLRKGVQEKIPSLTEIWDIPSLLARIPKLSAVIDLTNTDRYYDPNDFRKANVLHKKILMPGRVIPPEGKVKEFMNTVDEFLGTDCDSLIGVHCTHGLNRTGYMVCRYMRDRLGIPGPEALTRFELARGYKVERPVYINDIIKTESKAQNKGKAPRHERNKQGERIGENQSEQSSVFSNGDPGFHKPLVPPCNNHEPNNKINYFPRNSDERFGNSSYHSGRELRRPSNNFMDHNNFSAPASFKGANNHSAPINFKDHYSVPSNRSGPSNYSDSNNFNRRPTNYNIPSTIASSNYNSGPSNYSGPNNFSRPNNRSGNNTYSGSSNRSGPNNYRGPSNRIGTNNYKGSSNDRSGPSNFRGTNQRNYNDRYNDSGSRHKNVGNSNQVERNIGNNWPKTTSNQISGQYTWRNSNYGVRKPGNNSSDRRYDFPEDS